MRKRTINIILIILSIVIFFVSMFQSRIMESILRITSFLLNLYVFISSMYMIKKQNKKPIIIIIISLALSLFLGFGAVTGTISTLKIETYQRSEEYYIEQAHLLEDRLISRAKEYYDFDYYVENVNNTIFTITKSQMKSAFEFYEDELGTCDGYVVIKSENGKLNEIISEYKNDIMDDTYVEDYIKEYYYDSIIKNLDIKPYIKCNGNYNYQTNGYEETILVKTNTITIPKSYFEYTNTSPDETGISLLDLEYIKNFTVENNELIIELNDDQKQKLIKWNNNSIEEYVKEFKSLNENYKYEYSENKNQVLFFFDENLSSINYGKVFMIISGHALNNILKTNNYDWEINLKIVNCHTGKIVAEGIIPNDTFSWGKVEWDNSYQTDGYER